MHARQGVATTFKGLNPTAELPIKLSITRCTYCIWLCLVSFSVLIYQMHALGHRVELEAETCS